MSISDNIRGIRKVKDLSQAEVSRRLEIEPPSYHRLENRGNKLSFEQLEAIAKALEVSVLELLTWGDSKEPEKGKAQEVAQLQKENEELKKRVEELEDRLNDKNRILEDLQVNYEVLVNSINEIIESQVLGMAFEYNIGHVEVRNEITDEVWIETMKDFNNPPKEDGSNTSLLYADKVKLTDKELEIIIKALLEDEIYNLLLYHMSELRIIKDVQINQVYKKIEKRRLLKFKS